jgi:2,3-bisphosphoglycerate-independent phosphoglycerate mutase
MAELGTLRKIAPVPPSETPEAMYLGMPPSEAQMRQGPLTVAALGADPPERSTHFHLSILSFSEGAIWQPKLAIPSAEAEIIADQASRLNTKLLTFVKGAGLDHALVWEGLGDLQTTDPRAFDGQLIREVLPEGDAESILRRYIDDSINLFSEMEFNERRRDEGLPPFNVLWPWGHGQRTKVPNLALRLGEPANVESNSIRLNGLARLAGFRHGDLSSFGRGPATRLKPLAQRLLSQSASIVLITAAQEMRASGQLEELEWFARELDRELLAPLVEDTRREPSRTALLAPSSGTGLAVSFGVERRANSTPFREEALEERSIATADLWTLVNQVLEPMGARKTQA